MNMNLYAKLTKVDEAKRLIFGRAVDETPDRADEVFDYATSKGHFQDWSQETSANTDGKSLGNLRAMHGKVAAGKLTGIEFDDVNKAIDVCAHVVDDNEWNKVLEGVYTGFSIGGSYVKKWADDKVKKSDGKPASRYTAKPSELSLVDRPCVPSSRFFSIQKADGTTAEGEFKSVLTAEAIEAAARELCKGDGFSPETNDVTDPANPQPLWKSYESAATANLTKGFPSKDDAEDKEASAKGAAKDEGAAAESDEAKAKKAKDAEDAKKADGSGDLPAATTEYEVEGSDADVSKLADLMGTEKLTVGHVIKFVEDGLALGKIQAEEADILAKEDAGELKKGMYLVAQVAGIVEQLERIRSNVIYEEKSEGDSASKLPTKSGNLLAVACDLLREMVQEEAAELLAPEGNPSVDVLMRSHFADLKKIGARNSSSDSGRIQKVHDLAVELGCACGTKEAAEAPMDLTKVLASPDLQKALDGAIEKALAPVQKANAALLEKVAKLEAQPAAPRGVLRVVSKSADALETKDDIPATKPVVKNDQVNEVASLIKAAHQSGGVHLGLRPDGSSIIN